MDNTLDYQSRDHKISCSSNETLFTEDPSPYDLVVGMVGTQTLVHSLILVLNWGAPVAQLIKSGLLISCAEVEIFSIVKVITFHTVFHYHPSITLI